MKNRKRISIEGFWDITPKIKKLSFETRGKITISLEDGRTIMAPLSRFPGIKNLSSAQRAKWFLFGNGFSFDDSNEVYHIERILGNYQTYNHEVI